jgi:BirA family biotin operon repressor/biotin-[acetyl-CoA-carboxylase] ligase
LNELNKDIILKDLPSKRFNLHIYDEIDSTNDEAKRIEGIKDFHIFITEKQTKGRGRHGKKWSSPNSGNIYMTISTSQNTSQMNPISLISGLICKKAIDKLIRKPSIMLKWPNDILFNDKKIGGILVETEINKENIKTIIGIGINLNINKEESWWGDLSRFALESKRNELINLILTEFLNIFDNSYDNWLDDWKKSCMHINKEIEIFDGEHLQKKAIFKDIDAQGNAIIESKEGEEVIATGQISIKGVY